MRVDSGISRHELAQATGMSYNSLYRLESGKVKSPPLWWYQNCAIALGIKLEKILDYEHADWHGTDRAPEPPPPGWAKGRPKPKPPKPAPDATLPTRDSSKVRGRPSSLAED